MVESLAPALGRLKLSHDCVARSLAVLARRALRHRLMLAWAEHIRRPRVVIPVVGALLRDLSLGALGGSARRRSCLFLLVARFPSLLQHQAVLIETDLRVLAGLPGVGFIVAASRRLLHVVVLGMVDH